MKSIVCTAHDTFFYGIKLEKLRWNSTSIFRDCLLESKKVACKSCKKFKSPLKKLQNSMKSPLKKLVLIRSLFSRGTKYPLKRRNFHRKRFYILANAVFNCYAIRRWKKFHRLCYVHSKDKNATHTEKYARAGR